MRSAFFTILPLLILAGIPSFSLAQESIDIEEEFAFDISEFEKSPLEFGGYLQLNASCQRMDRESVQYKLSLFDEEQDEWCRDGRLELQPEVVWRQGSLKAFLLANLKGSYSGEEWGDDLNLFEGNLSYQVNPNLYVSLGKTLVRWGKGYAWNPVNLVGRPKNPSDPELALEGYWLGLVDIVRSFPGDLRTLALTCVVFPVENDMNSDFGEEGHISAAGKIYLLFHNTDIDLLMLSEGSRTLRFGLDFSRNLTSNFEIHGEWARINDFNKSLIARDGATSVETYNASSSLIGLRYLAPTETTFILEYYQNGEGYSKGEAESFFAFIDQATDTQLLNVQKSAKAYQKPNFMMNYLYLRASQKEPLGLLHLNPAMTTVVNLDDGSYNLTPEVVYTGVTNLELRFRFTLLSGHDGTEYGEKQIDSKIEVQARYSF